jgi:putative colanic acid biosynthesis UDP-glucose lipid carrier transferase
MTEISEARPTSSTIREPAAARSLIKSIVDRVGALLGLILISPLLSMVAIAVRLDSPGPVLFTQPRYGRNGEVFRVYKFRTMTAAASREPFRQASAGDLRVTRLGRVLRRTSVDELPQLFNVLRGEMSLVGPRPHPPALDETYRELIPNYMYRYSVRPGMTGLAQVRGHRGPTPTVQSMEQRVALDLAYIAEWSLWLDARILVRTPWLCLFEVSDDD